MPEIKICGLTRAVDAAAAADAGATFGGVILAPGSPRTVVPERVEEIFSGVGLIRCGVFVNEPEARVLELVERLKLGVVQLHGDESAQVAASIAERTGAAVWKAVQVRNAEDFVAAAETYSGAVDALLLDGWSAVARGGTGARFPWREVAMHRERLAGGTRLVAAGGLNPGNVGEVVELLQPDIVDVSSGVERSPGTKDDELIRRFAEAAGAAVAQKGAG